MSDDDEFLAFVGANYHRLRRAALLLTGDERQAEDAAQTALTRTYASWSRIRRRDQDAYAYSRRVLTNHLADQWRRPIREIAHEFLPDRPTWRDMAEDVSQQQWVIDALSALAGRERAVVVLRHYFDMSVEEVAAELGVATGTVKSLNARALAKLRVSLDHERV